MTRIELTNEKELTKVEITKDRVDHKLHSQCVEIKESSKSHSSYPT